MKEVDKIERWLRNVGTRWDVRDVIVEVLRNLETYPSFLTTVPDNPYDELLQVAAEQQEAIGVEKFLQGYVLEVASDMTWP